MRVIVVLVSLLLAGFVAAFGLKVAGVESVTPPSVLINLLLGIGLYAAATGIDFRAARRDARLIVAAISVGVLLKAALVLHAVSNTLLARSEERREAAAALNEAKA